MVSLGMQRRWLALVLIGLLLCPIESRASSVAAKMRSIVIPSIELNEVPLSDAVQFLQARSQELDPTREGVNIIISAPDAVERTISVQLVNVTLGRCLWFVGILSGTIVDVDAHAILLKPAPAGWSLPASEPDAEILAKVARITIPSVEFQDTPLPDALEFLYRFSVELDTKEPDVSRRGINIVRIPPPGEIVEVPTITMRLSNVPLSEAIRYTASLASQEVRIMKGAIVLLPESP